MGYLLTPEERRARARAFIANKNARQEYQRALSLERANKNAEAARKAEIESKPFIVRAGASFGDVIGNVITGATKGVEGIVDIGIGAVGAVGGIFDDDFQDKMKAAVSYDFTGNVVGQPLQDAFKYSYWEENGLVDQFAQGVGQMLPAVIATIATYGAYGGFAAAGSAASAASAANTASLITMGASAAGNATEEAFNEGANYYAGLGYGVASGAVEVATEKLAGGIMKNVTGAGIFDGVRVSIADTGAKRFIKGAIEEGAEEMVAEAFSPALKSIYKGREAFDAYKDAETYKNIGKAGLMGAAVSSFYGGTVNVALAKAGIGAVGKEADISESLTEIEAIKKRMNQYQANGKLNADNRAKFDASIKGNYDNVEKALKSSSAEKRKKMIDKFNLGSAFDDNGSMRSEFHRRINREVDESTLPESLRAEAAKIREATDRGAYSANLIGEEASIAADLAEMRFNLYETAILDAEQRGTNIDSEAYAERLNAIKVSNETLDDSVSTARRDLNRTVNRFNSIANTDLSFVIVDTGGTMNAAIKGGRIYVSSESLRDGTWVSNVVHELTHAEQGTEEYNKLRDFLLSDKVTVTDANGKKISLFEQAKDMLLRKGYAITRDKLAEIDEKNRQGVKLTEEEQRIEATFSREVTAHAAELLLGNEDFINRFVADEATLAERTITRFNDIKKALQSLKSEEARKQLATIRKAEKLYYRAAMNAGNTKLAKMISPEDRDEDYKPSTPEAARMSGKIDRTRNGFQFELSDGENKKITAGMSDEQRYEILKNRKIENIQNNIDYMDAVNRGDMETAQRMVDEAAKKAGYSTEHLYHGTSTFGFTKVDVEGASDDSISFFATNNIEVAQGYMPWYEDDASDRYHEDVRRIGKTNESRLQGLSRSLSAEKILAEAQKLYPEYKSARVATDEEVLADLKNYWLADAIQAAKSLRNIEISIASAKVRQQIKSMCDAVIDANEANTYSAWKNLAKQYKEFEKIDIPYDANDMRPRIMHAHIVGGLQHVSNVSKSTVIMLNDGRLTNTALIVDRYNSELGGEAIGIYDMYAKRDKQLVIQGGGSVWNNLTLGKHESAYRSWLGEESAEGALKVTTRDVALFAKSTGYRSVVFYDIYDSGIYGNSRDISDVYAFFYPQEDIKSADPVTYDDNGDVIPLSKRFDFTNDDIRFSLPENVPEIITREDGTMGIKHDPFAYWGIKQHKVTPSQSEKNATPADDIPAAKSINDKINEKNQEIYDKAIASLKRGQIKQRYADLYNRKVFSRSESAQVVNDIISTLQGEQDESFRRISGKSQKEAVEILWESLNTKQDKSKVADQLAEYVINATVVNELINDPENYDVRVLETLKSYRRHIDLTPLKNSEFFKYKNNRTLYTRWAGGNKSAALPLDTVIDRLSKVGINITAEGARNQIVEIDNLFFTAKNKVNESINERLKQFYEGNPTGLNDTKKMIREKILEIYKKGGKPSAYQKMLDENNFYYWENANKLLAKIRKLRETKRGAFVNASTYRNDMVSAAILKLTRIEHLGNLNRAGARAICQELNQWYSTDNPVLRSVDRKEGVDTSRYSVEVKQALERIVNGEGPLKTNDIRDLIMIVEHMVFLIETHNKARYQGKLVDASELVKQWLPIAQSANPARSWGRKIVDKYIETFQSPEVVARYFDGYKDGFYTNMMHELRNASTNSEVMRMALNQPLEEFVKKNKGFYNKLQDHEIKYNGVTLDANKAMTLYMTLHREQAMEGLARNGFTYETDKGVTVRPAGFETDDKVKITDDVVKPVRDALWAQFTDAEREYIRLVESLLTQCKEIKRGTDMIMKGFSNVIEGYYVPIYRANIAKTIDTTYLDEMRATNASFNKDTVRGAKNELFINDLTAIIDRHISGISMYANLAPTLDAYNTFINLDLDNNANKPVTIKTESANRWPTADSYFRKLVADIQHIPAIKPDGTMVDINQWSNRFISAYAKSVLGANPKVIMTQVSSLFAASSVISVKSLIKGYRVSGKDATQVSDLAALRAHNNEAARAMGVLDKIDKFSDIFMKGISAMDNHIVRRIYAACQVEVQSKQGLKIGTAENKLAAAKLLETVIYETQQSALATEKSAAMRSGNALYKTLTMFRADAMKVMGQVFTASGELALAHRNYKSNPNSETKSEVARAGRKLAASIAALIMSALYNALIALGFKFLYNKVKEDDEVGKDFLADLAGNMIGGLPIISDLIDVFVTGFNPDSYNLVVINDLLDAVSGLFDLIDGNGNTKLSGAIRKMIFASAQVFGLPFKNVYNVITGLISRISPSTGYAIDEFFVNKSLSADLYKAIEKGDEKMVAQIAALIVDENFDNLDSKPVRHEVKRLIEAGYNVMPRVFDGTVTVDGETVELTRRESSAFERIYNIAGESVTTLVSYKTYNDADDKIKANAIKRIYSIYYNLAMRDYIGDPTEDKTVLMAEAIPVEKLALIAAYVAEITADIDRAGNPISGSRKRKIQSFVNSLKLTVAEKYIVMGYLGYKNTNGEDMVKRHISKLRLSAEEKKLLLKYSGYESA